MRAATSKRRALPPDPDGQNNDRAKWAEGALRAFMQETGCDPEDAIADLLANLMHFCDRNEMTINAEMNRACAHYRAETSDSGEWTITDVTLSLTSQQAEALHGFLTERIQDFEEYCLPHVMTEPDNSEPERLAIVKDVTDMLHDVIVNEGAGS